MPFIFATGIEGSYPTVPDRDGGRIRVDEMEKTGHYKRWHEDFELVADLRIKYLRYGPPYFKTHVGAGKYDWSIPDETLPVLQRMGITVIADLCHFGVPDWLENFQNPEWPRYFAEYAGAFARRYPHIRLYTPVNEIFIAATFSALYGWWNEGLKDERSFVRAIKHLCQANLLAMQSILKEIEQPVFVQSESSEYFHAETPAVLEKADFLNEKRFLALDLTYGHPVSVKMYEYLLIHGMTREEYYWFGDNHSKARCLMGTDYYITNEHLVREDGETEPSGEIFGYYVITRQYHDRYGLPIMHTETNHREPDAVAWLMKEWANMHRLQQDGLPIMGFTWYSLIDQMDWDTALREQNGNVNALGLFDIDRKIRPVGEAYRKLIADWRNILPTEGLNLWVYEL